MNTLSQYTSQLKHKHATSIDCTPYEYCSTNYLPLDGLVLITDIDILQLVSLRS